MDPKKPSFFETSYLGATIPANGYLVSRADGFDDDHDKDRLSNGLECAQGFDPVVRSAMPSVELRSTAMS